MKRAFKPIQILFPQLHQVQMVVTQSLLYVNIHASMQIVKQIEKSCLSG